MSNTIAEYIASLRFHPDVASLRNVDRFLRIIERRVERSNRRMSERFNINPFNTDSNRNRNNRNLNLPDRTRPQPPPRERTLIRETGNAYSGVKGLAGASIAGFGFGALNDTLQRLEMLPVALEAVTGSSEKAAKELEFLSKLGHDIGATRLELAPSYTKMLASAVGTPLEKEMHRIFSSLTVYGKVMGLDQEEMKGSFKAVAQMINKQQIMAEELKGQLAERLPAAVRIMAEAVTNGDTVKLLALMKAGKLDPNVVLPKFAIELESRAAGGIEKYRKTTRAQQNFSRVALEDQIINFGKEGGNKGFFRIWKSFADTLKNSSNIVKLLADGFGALSRVVQAFGNTLQVIDTILGKFYELPAQFQVLGNIAALVFTGMIFKAKVLGGVLARAFWPLTAIYLVMQDIWGYMHGMDSVTGDIVKAFGSKDVAAARSATTPTGITVDNTLNRKVDPNSRFAAAKRLRDAERQNAASLANLPATNATNLAEQAKAQNAKAWAAQEVNIHVDATGNSADSAALAKAISDQLTQQLKPVLLNKVPVE